MTSTTASSEVGSSGVSIGHPSWCDRTLCTVHRSGWHWSLPITIEPDPRNNIRAEIQLSRDAGEPGQPDALARIDLTVYVLPFEPDDTGEELTLTVTGERAVTLGRMLASAGHAATHG